MAGRDFFAVRVTTPENTLPRGHPRKPLICNNLISISFKIKWFRQSTVNLPTGSFSFEVFFFVPIFPFLRHVVIDQCHIDA